jgi:hypothetical protein
MSNYILSLNIFNQNIQIQELTYKQYRIFSKCFLGDELDTNTIFINLNNLLLKNTTLSQQDLNNLSYIDYFLILLYLRAVSIGDTITLNYQKNDKAIKLQLGIEGLINDLSNKIVNVTDFNISNINIKLKHPSITDLIYFKNNSNYFFNTFFIKEVIINEHVVNLLECTYPDKEKIVLHLPAKIISILNQKIQTIFDNVYNYNLLQSLKTEVFSETLPFIPNIDVLSYFAKLLFYNNFENVYENIFVLSKAANISAEFLDSCTPGEVMFFIKKLEEYNQQQEKQNNNSSDELPPITSEFTGGL